MVRKWARWVLGLTVVFLLTGGLGLGGLVIASQYLFQEPAYVTWSRYLQPEFYWQRQKYPSLRWAFDLFEPFVHHPDPRGNFTEISSAPLSYRPAARESAIVGPVQQKAVESDLARESTVHVATAEELKHAIETATPGTMIEILPGVYDFSGRSILIRNAGEKGRPILVRGSELGTVRLRFNLLEGFHVLAPHWIFENLTIEGICERDSRCEHAFHVVGPGYGVVIRNNWVLNFNAAIKVNGQKEKFPDGGLIERNAFINSRPRNTGNPVTPLDIVAVANWRVRKNIIADFAKAGSDHISYGAFFKGGGKNNIFEQNLVRCEWRHAGGTRIGFSFGGGGTSRTACRDGNCSAEHSNGIARNNIIMNCPNDVGIYLNKSARTHIHNNALINTRGIDVRFSQSTGMIANNIIDGRILSREGGTYAAENNIIAPLKAAFLGNVSTEIYADPEAGDFRLNDLQSISGRGIPIDEPAPDLCGQSYDTAAPDIGPIQYNMNLNCTPVLP